MDNIEQQLRADTALCEELLSGTKYRPTDAESVLEVDDWPDDEDLHDRVAARLIRCVNALAAINDIASADVLRILQERYIEGE